MIEYNPIIAILRGVTPEYVLEIADLLIRNKFNIIEVPLNSPKALTSINKLVKEFSDIALIGAGTVLTRLEVEDVFKTGAKLIVSPNTDKEIIKRTRELNMISIPGCFTPSEAILAINSGASGIKLFPADTIGIRGFRALKQVIPNNVKVFAVGGINSQNIKDWVKAEINGFGIGSSLFNPKLTFTECKKSIENFADIYEDILKRKLNYIKFE